MRRDGERCLRLLVEGGAKINAPEQKSGNTALHLAVRENLFKVACTLITELKAEVNVCSFGGNTPLHLAASLGSPTLCSMLIAAGDDGSVFSNRVYLIDDLQILVLTNEHPCSSGADKNMENDEPLLCSSSSDEDEPDGETSQPVTRKRPAGGHTPLDLANCQKVCPPPLYAEVTLARCCVPPLPCPCLLMSSPLCPHACTQVRNLLNSRNSPKSSCSGSKKMKPTSEGLFLSSTMSHTGQRSKFRAKRPCLVRAKIEEFHQICLYMNVIAYMMLKLAALQGRSLRAWMRTRCPGSWTC